MPTPAKTSHDELVRIARQLVDEAGPEALTLTAVARIAGVKAPSIYKHFADRLALLKAVEMDVLAELERALRSGTSGSGSTERLRSMAATYRTFALGKPHRYAAIYSGNAAEDPELGAACLRSARPLFEELERAGMPPERVLPVSRTITAFLHGFVSMEIANAFWLGGNVDDAFNTGLDTILQELAS